MDVCGSGYSHAKSAIECETIPKPGNTYVLGTYFSVDPQNEDVIIQPWQSL